MAAAPERLRKNIRLWMTERGMKQTQLAKTIGIKQPYLSQVLNGHRDISTAKVQRIAQALAVPIEQLWAPNAGIKRLKQDSDSIDPLLRERLSELNQLGRARLMDHAQLLASAEEFRINGKVSEIRHTDVAGLHTVDTPPSTVARDDTTRTDTAHGQEVVRRRSKADDGQTDSVPRPSRPTIGGISAALSGLAREAEQAQALDRPPPAARTARQHAATTRAQATRRRPGAGKRRG